MIPSTNGHGNARAIAALYDAHLRGEVAGAGREGRLRIAGAALRAEAVKIVSDGLDRVLSRPSRLGLGFQPPRPTRPIGPSPDAYGHFGYGGSLAWPTPRTQRLLAAVYACL